MRAVRATTGDQLLNEVLDLLCKRLPDLDTADPVYERFSQLVPQMAAALGRPAVRLAATDGGVLRLAREDA